MQNDGKVTGCGNDNLEKVNLTHNSVKSTGPDESLEDISPMQIVVDFGI